MSATALLVKGAELVKTVQGRKPRRAKDLFSARLRSVLKTRRWKAADLARALTDAGAEKATGSLAASWVRGARLPSAPYIALISRVLEIDAESLLDPDGSGWQVTRRSPVNSAALRVAERPAEGYGTGRPPVAPLSAPKNVPQEVWQVVYDAVARAYEKMVVRNELAGRMDGIQRAIEMVNMMIYALNEMGEDTTDLSRAALWLHKRARGELPPEAEGPPAPQTPTGSGT